MDIDDRVGTAEDLGSLLERVPSAQVRRLGGLGDYATVSLRSAGARTVLVSLDGIPLNPDGAASVNLAELPLSMLERVEVHRSGTPLALGSAPMGGSINLSTTTAPDLAAAGSIGSMALRRLSASGLTAGERGDVLATAEGFSTTGEFRYFSNNGTPYAWLDDTRPRRANNDKGQVSGLWRARTTGPVQAQVLQSVLHREEGLPGHANQPSQHARLETTRHLLGASARASLGATQVLPMAWAVHRTEWLDDRAGEVGLANFYERTQSSSYGAGVTSTFAPGEAWSSTTNVTVRADRLDRLDLATAQADAPRHRRTLTAATAADAWLAGGRVRVHGAVQAAMLDSRLLGDIPWASQPFAGDGPKPRWVGAPRVGAAARLSRSTAVKATLGRGYRVPDLTELFGRRGALIGNAELRSETSWSADIGVVTRHDGPVAFTGEVAAFSAQRRDAIVYVQNGQGSSLPVNLGDTSTTGLEAGLSLRNPWLDSQTSATLTRAVEVSSERAVPRVPLASVAQHTWLRGGPLALGHQFLWQSAEFLDAANFEQAPARALHGLHLRGRAGSLTAELAILNLFDRTTALVDRNPLDDADATRVVRGVQDFNGYPLPGRTWMLTLRTAPTKD